MLEGYGRDAVVGSIAQIRRHGAEVARHAAAAIHARLVVEGDRLAIDLTEVSRQVSGYFNSEATVGWSAAQVAFKGLPSRRLLPINKGQIERLGDKAGRRVAMLRRHDALARPHGSGRLCRAPI